MTSELWTELVFGTVECAAPCYGTVSITIDTMLRAVATCHICGRNRKADLDIELAKGLLEAIGTVAKPEPCAVENCDCDLAKAS